MKKILILAILFFTMFIGNINVNACTTSDGCSGCPAPQAKDMCDAELKRKQQEVEAKCAQYKGNTSAYEACKSGNKQNANITIPNNNTKPQSGTTGSSSSGNNGTGNIGNNGFDCTKCEQYSSKDDKRNCYVNNGCELPNDLQNGSSYTPGNNTVAPNLTDNVSNINDLDGCEAVFGIYTDGKFTDKNSLGYFLQLIFNIIKYAVPIILIVLTSADFVKATASGEKDNIKKALQTLYKRGIIAVVIFLLPTILQIILGLVTTYGTCGVK